MNQLDNVTRTIRFAVKEATGKTMSLQSAKALAAKVMGERNMHVASNKSPVATAKEEDGFTWHVVGHYDDMGQPFHSLVRAKDGFSALLELTLRLRQENSECLPSLVLQCAINAFTGRVAFPSDESDATVFVEDLVEHLENYAPFTETHPELAQNCELKVDATGGYLVKIKGSVEEGGPVYTDSKGFLYIDGMGDSTLLSEFQNAFAGIALPPATEEQTALEKEFARIDAMSHWDLDEKYPPEDWIDEVRNSNTRLSYKEWLKSQYEMNQDN